MKPIQQANLKIQFTHHAREREAERLKLPLRTITIDILKNLHKARRSRRHAERFLIEGLYGNYVMTSDGFVITIMGKDLAVE